MIIANFLQNQKMKRHTLTSDKQYSNKCFIYRAYPPSIYTEPHTDFDSIIMYKQYDTETGVYSIHGPLTLLVPCYWLFKLA